MQQRSEASNRLFHYAEDRWPVAILCSVTAIDFALYFTVDNVFVLAAYGGRTNHSAVRRPISNRRSPRSGRQKPAPGFCRVNKSGS